ncbi:MAG: hypothetical protein BWY63_00899 [Chloroflexi bacterium ADurb.Bin360]|nr:MAG: hypothetical protein BWY63_00899 [Chloroflexi bacterium ADurb.Bin360]
MQHRQPIGISLYLDRAPRKNCLQTSRRRRAIGIGNEDIKRILHTGLKLPAFWHCTDEQGFRRHRDVVGQTLLLSCGIRHRGFYIQEDRCLKGSCSVGSRQRKIKTKAPLSIQRTRRFSYQTARIAGKPTKGYLRTAESFTVESRRLHQPSHARPRQIIRLLSHEDDTKGRQGIGIHKDGTLGNGIPHNSAKRDDSGQNRFRQL